MALARISRQVAERVMKKIRFSSIHWFFGGICREQTELGTPSLVF